MARAKKPEGEGLTARMPVTAMTQEMYEWVTDQADEQNKSRGDIIRDAVALYMKHIQKAKKGSK